MTFSDYSRIVQGRRVRGLATYVPPDPFTVVYTPPTHEARATQGTQRRHARPSVQPVRRESSRHSRGIRRGTARHEPGRNLPARRNDQELRPALYSYPGAARLSEARPAGQALGADTSLLEHCPRLSVRLSPHRAC